MLGAAHARAQIAENPDALVLDVKTGSGSFNVEEAKAIELAQAMVASGEGAGKATVAFVTGMDQVRCAAGCMRP